MQSSARSPEDEKTRMENLPETFASLRTQIERMLTELQTLESHFKKDFQQSLANVAVAVEEQLKEAVSAAEQVVRKQTLNELRAKYIREVELAITEKGLIERRLQVSTKQFDEQKHAWETKLNE